MTTTGEPTARSANAAWAIAPFEYGAQTYDSTGIHHADLACPAIRDWQTSRPDTATVLLELDTTRGVFVEWVNRVGTWKRMDDEQPLTREQWRACLRCGSSPQAPVLVCARCMLTTCDCDD